ncbi:alcohol dehydrogenase GroES-like domain-containing protein [Byssothecium circinans]|uniref:Alcohol dehydrogenase GroES-like domain-containing protein n=1 Tax=Byssothecium circinans TaxID=147558 RepID=A0A6A5TBU3_9PLEO|nr:alcohol dehydrogenase GroES-like domain-containing protein [Byssothecium circinans]
MTSPLTPPTTQPGLVVDDHDNVIIRRDCPFPSLPPDQVLVRVHALGVNPSDTKMRGPFALPYAILGADFAGEVVAIGADVTNVQIGDRVCGAQNELFKASPERGAFANYNVTRGRMWMKIPDAWSYEAAASLPVGLCTAGLALKLLGLPLPDQPEEKGKHVLVYGGSTATATIAIQLLKLSGLIPIAVCSPKNFALARSNGAEEVFDRHDKECAQKIKSYTKNNLTYALDCITSVESTILCFAAIGRAGGKYVSLDPWQEHAATRKVVKCDFTVGPRVFGEGCTWPAPYGSEPDEELKEFGVKLWDVAEKLVAEGKLKNHPLKVLDAGFEAIIAGMELIRDKKLSGEKIIVRMYGGA